MSGAPCFRGTRVPVQGLIDFLERGETIGQFLTLYPSISRQQVLTGARHESGSDGVFFFCGLYPSVYITLG